MKFKTTISAKNWSVYRVHTRAQTKFIRTDIECNSLSSFHFCKGPAKLIFGRISFANLMVILKIRLNVRSYSKSKAIINILLYLWSNVTKFETVSMEKVGKEVEKVVGRWIFRKEEFSRRISSPKTLQIGFSKKFQQFLI